jgi:hypothetical protein
MVARQQRFRKGFPCPICGGYEEGKRGTPERCWGYISDDGRYAHCVNDAHAGSLEKDSASETYAHRLEGECRCGDRHGVHDEDRSSRNGHERRRIETRYRYVDEHGTLLYEAVRYRPKGFSQRRPNGPGDWIHNLEGVRRVLYRLPEVLEAIASGKLICVAEGEADVDVLWEYGYPATTNAMGAKKWQDPYSQALKDATEVVIFGDNDHDGRAHVAQVTQSLQAVGLTPRLAQLDGLPEHGDVRDWLKTHTQADLDRVVAEAVVVEAAPEDQDQHAAGAEEEEIAAPRWPVLDDQALHGLAGDVVRVIAPHTEADPVAILIQTLVSFGNVIDRTPHCTAEADYHALNEFAVLVGATSKGRKGTSAGQVRRLYARVAPDWAAQHIQAGLSSGEGLIWAVRDAIVKSEPIREKGKPTGTYQDVVVDQGVSDKRLLVLEAEFASTLRVIGREGNTLSAIIREAWDTGELRVLTKNSPAKATGAHISIIGHITRDELLRYLDSTESGNGFGNRILWCCVRRSQALPEGGQLKEADLNGVVKRLHEAITAAAQVHDITRDPDARAIWRAVYAELSEGKPGLLGAMTSRAEAHVMRLSALYALLDQSAVVKADHLKAALALWEYCEASARFIFGEALGDPLADEILQLLRTTPEGMTRTDIYNHFGRHQPAEQIMRALTLLAQQGLATYEKQGTEGRPTTIWTAIGSAQKAH